MKQNNFSANARRIAYRGIYGLQNRNNKGIKAQFDLRCNVSHEALNFIYTNSLVTLEAVNEVSLKRKQRRENRPVAFSNILDEGIVRDYFNNKSDISHITDEGIIFKGQRNHWAHNDQDHRILSVLKKCFENNK